MNAVKHIGCLGVPLAKPRVALSATSPRAEYRTVGFSLQSLTRNLSKVLCLCSYFLIGPLALLPGCSVNSEIHVGNSEMNASIDDERPVRSTLPIGAGGIYLGMTLEQAKALYPNGTFEEVPVYEYGMDASYNGLLIEDHRGPLMFLHPDEVSDTIIGISLLSPKLTVGKDICTGMSVSEFIERYPNATIEIDAIDNSIEIGYVAKESFRVEFLTTDSTRVGLYELVNGDPAFRGIQRPDARIDRIMI